jgi:hypothetical protein
MQFAALRSVRAVWVPQEKHYSEHVLGSFFSSTFKATVLKKEEMSKPKLYQKGL